MKKIIKVLTVLLLAMSMISPAAFAKSDDAKESLVALGDSIPFGYNLGNTNNTLSKAAYPYLIGADQDWRVRNLAVPGMQSHQLLHTLKYDQKYRQAVRHSDYITISIGSNDLINILYETLDEFSTLPQSVIGPDTLKKLLLKNVFASKIFLNIEEVIKEIQLLTNAPIVIYNVYTPVQPLEPSEYILVNQVLSLININFAGLTTSYDNLYIADAFRAFHGKQGALLLPDDVHPSLEGQAVLSEIGISAFGLESKSKIKTKTK